MKNPKKWEVYWVDFSPAKGSEQDGLRPGIVVSNTILNTRTKVYMVIPLTKVLEGSKKINPPTNVFIEKNYIANKHDSVALTNQMRPIAEERLRGKINTITSWDIKTKINDAIKFMLNFDGCHNCNVPITPTSLKCYTCKTDVQKSCGNCSNIVPFTHLYCYKCGGKV